VHWDDPEGWYGEGGGRGVQDWEHVYTCGGFMLASSEVVIFLLAILIPACASSSLTFHRMYSAEKLNKQGDNIQP